jgi:catechol 2,3-dioxygenase-like lactoylglutathione lyase family enzyme
MTTIRKRRGTMAKIRHIAIATQNEDETAKFYIDVFGLSQVGKIDIPAVSGYFLTDGDINVAILHFKNDQVAGVERGKEWTGIHHIGFQVESLEEIAQKIAAAGGSPREDINQALGLLSGPAGHGNAEVRYSGPDGVTFDVSRTGWVGTPRSGRRSSSET